MIHLATFKKLSMGAYDHFVKYFIKNNLRGKDRLYGFLQKVGFREKIISNAKYGIKLYLNPKEYIDSLIIQEEII